MSTVTLTPPVMNVGAAYNGHDFSARRVPDNGAMCRKCGYVPAGSIVGEYDPTLPICPGRWPHDPPKTVVQLCDACGYDGSAKHLCNHFAWAAETNSLLKRIIGLATPLPPGAKPELPGNAADQAQGLSPGIDRDSPS